MRFIRGHSRRKFHPDSPEYIEDAAGCWIWARTRDPEGYGYVDSRRAHRVMYERHNGPIPAGMHLHHTCHNPPCVNPAHLVPLTAAVHQRLRRDTKINATVAEEIRTSHETGVLLAKRYGISRAMISLIRAGKRWSV